MSYDDFPCQDFVELASDYLEGTLTSSQRLVVERHLAFCSICGDYLQEMRLSVQLTGRLREEDVPEPIMESLLEAFRTLRGGEG